MTVIIKTQDNTNLRVLIMVPRIKLFPLWEDNGWIPSMIREGRETSGFSFDAQGFFGLLCKFLQIQVWASDYLFALVAHRAAPTAPVHQGHLSLWPLGGTRQGQGLLSLASSCPKRLVRPVATENSYFWVRMVGIKNGPRNWSRR